MSTGNTNLGQPLDDTMAPPVDPATLILTQINDRLSSLENNMGQLLLIEPSLKILHSNIVFFEGLTQHLNSRLSVIENTILQGLPAQIEQAQHRTKSEIVQDAIKQAQEAVRAELDGLRKTMDDFRRDASAQWATKTDLQTAQLSAGTATVVNASSKPKVFLPDAFSGKREEWKSFLSHMTVFFTGNTGQYPTDTDKILFAISRLGKETSAFKYMEHYIPDFNKAPADRPSIICDWKVFLKTMTENFGAQNARVVAEAQLRALKQKGSAMDYTNRFQELAAETDWNDSAKISQYRVGLKEAVQDMLSLIDQPTDFAIFTAHAIRIDKLQYARAMEKQHGQRSMSSSSSSATRTSPATVSTRSANPPTFAPAAPSAPSMAMDLSQVRHISPEEKKRRLENGLCLYCSADDHFAKKCPNKKTLASTEVVQNSSTPDSVVFTLGKGDAQ